MNRRVLAALLGLVWASWAAGQTTGGLVGKVTEPGGTPLGGVAVEAKGPALQGTRSASSSAEGGYRLSLLPPGEYTVTFTLEGFAAETLEGVVVNLDRDTTLNMPLRPVTAEEITVTAREPVIDTTSTTLGVNISKTSIELLPSGRNYSSVVQITPGVSADANPENTDQSTITVYGSSGAENTFLIDGINTTGIEYGFQGKQLNFEFIQAIDVKAGGYEAEFGRSTGGVINVITKSGGNELRGDVFGYLDDDSLQSSTDPVVTTGGIVQGFSKEDYGADLGGYIVRDKLWFFAAYDKVDHSTDTLLTSGPDAGGIVESTSDRDLAAAKLTYNIATSQSLIATFFQDPQDDAGAINDRRIDHSLNGEPSTYLGVQKFGGRDYALRYEGIFGSNWLVTGQVATHEEENSVAPASQATDVVQFREAALDFFQTGGFGLIQGKDFSRDSWSAAVERFFRRHDLKAGIELESEEAQVIKRMSGGQRVDLKLGATDRTVYEHFYWTTPTATLDNAPTSQLDATPKHDNTTIFAQDRWQVRDNLTINLGVRWDRQEIFDRFGERVIDLSDDYAPRLGFVWDPTSDGGSKLFGSYGRYYEQIPMDLVIRSFAQERQARIFNFSPTGTTPDPAAEAELGRESVILGGFFEPADPNMKNQFIHEYILGYEREVAPHLAVGVKGIYREYGRVVEDFLCPNPETGEVDGTYCIGNPAEGIMERIFAYDYVTEFPAPEAEREFKGVQLDVTRRFADNWSGLASYLYAKLDGNYDGEYSPFTNVGADPNISALYDYYDFFTDGVNFDRITNDGPLSNDRRHQLKFSGVYFTPIKLQVGGSAYYRTGTPLTRYGFFDGYGRYELFLTPRGGEGRQPDTYELSVHLGYPIEVGRATINVLLDVFNVLNAQRPILLDQRWGFQQADNAEPNPVNPGYLQPLLRTPPTTFRFGVRVSF